VIGWSRRTPRGACNWLNDHALVPLMIEGAILLISGTVPEEDFLLFDVRGWSDCRLGLCRKW